MKTTKLHMFHYKCKHYASGVLFRLFMEVNAAMSGIFELKVMSLLLLPYNSWVTVQTIQNITIFSLHSYQHSQVVSLINLEYIKITCVHAEVYKYKKNTQRTCHTSVYKKTELSVGIFRSNAVQHVRQSV